MLDVLLEFLACGTKIERKPLGRRVERLWGRLLAKRVIAKSPVIDSPRRQYRSQRQEPQQVENGEAMK